jgi:hypothetical protein
LSGTIFAKVGLFRGVNHNPNNVSDDGSPTDDGSIGPSWGWFVPSATSGFGSVPEQAAAAAWFGWAGVKRLQSFAAPSLGPHMSPASGPSGGSTSRASGATPPDPDIAADIASQEQNGSLSYNSVLTILDDAAAGGMTASKFAALQGFASELNVPGGISVSAYVQQIADDVIDGNSANATWNGCASTATKLGDLIRASSQTQADDLIDEWFLGAHLPSLGLAAVGEANLHPTYQNSTLPLYGPTGAPTGNRTM